MQQVLKNVAWLDLSGDLYEVLCVHSKWTPLSLREDRRRTVTFELALECSWRSWPGMEGFWHPQGANVEF